MLRTLCATRPDSAPSGNPSEPATRRNEITLALFLVSLPCIEGAQSLSLTHDAATGNCNGTSCYQAADASGKFLAAEWAVANGFPLGINRGRVRCTIPFSVTVQAGFRIVPGGGSQGRSRPRAQ